MAQGVMTRSLPCKVPGSALVTVDMLSQRPSSFTVKKHSRSRVQRNNTLSGVTDQARKVLDELLVRGSDEKDVVKKEIPFSAPTPYEGSSSLVNGTMGGFLDVSSPLSDDDGDRVDGSHKRRPSHGISTVLGDSSPSPVEPSDPHEIASRKKKTFFVRAKERLRETLRRDEKKPLTPSDEKADLEAPPGRKKNPWRLSFKKKKHKKAKRGKENDEVPSSMAASEKSSSRWSGLFPSASTSKDSRSRHHTTGQHMVTPPELAPQRHSLPPSSAHACDIEATVPARSVSTDETRLHTVGPDQLAILRRYFSTAGRSRTSDSRPSSSMPATKQSTSISTSSTSTKEGRGGHHSLRKNLHLEGLVVNYPAAPTVNGKRYGAPLAVPEDSHLTPDEEDFIDGGGISQESTVVPTSAGNSSAPTWSDRPLVHATSKPFSEKSSEEREELYGRIAEQLDLIGDSYYFGTSVDGRKTKEKDATDGALATANFDTSRTASTSSLSEITVRIGDLMRNTDYDTFQRVVSRTIGSEAGIEQIAAMFRMTKCAVHLAGIGTSAARSIKEMAIRYFEDYFAPWVVDEGGWESVVEDSATDMDLD